jgi:hypothetical protein
MQNWPGFLRGLAVNMSPMKLQFLQRKRLLFSTLIVGVIFVVMYFVLAPAWSSSYHSPQFQDGKFRNPIQVQKYSAGEQAQMWWAFLFDKPSVAATMLLSAHRASPQAGLDN